MSAKMMVTEHKKALETAQLREQVALLTREKHTLLYWLARVYEAYWRREGWETGPSETETRTDVSCVLANAELDPTLNAREYKLLLDETPRFDVTPEVES